MLIWPANSWVFWLVVAAGLGLYLRLALFSATNRRMPRHRRVVRGVLAGIVTVATAALPSLVFYLVAGAGFSGDRIDAAMWTVAVVLGALALLTAGWALFRDRAGKLRHCPKCWYDMSGVTSLTCSECGYSARVEQQLHARRRRWGGVVLAGLLITAAIGTAHGPDLRDGGWSRAIPDVVLLALMPYPTGSAHLEQEFSRRIEMGLADRTMSAGGLRSWVADWAVRRSLRTSQTPGVNAKGLAFAEWSTSAFDLFLSDIAALASSGNAPAMLLMVERAPGDSRTRAAAESLIVHRHVPLRTLGVYALARSEQLANRTENLVPRLEELALSDDPAVRATVMNSLREMPMTPAVSALVDSGLQDADFKVRRSALSVLAFGHADDSRLRLTLHAWLTGQNVEHRNFAVWLVAMYGPVSNELVEALPEAIVNSLSTTEHDDIFLRLVEGPLSGVECVEVFAACGQDAKFRPLIVKAVDYLGVKAPQSLVQLVELEARWRAEGDAASADAMAAVIRGIEERLEQVNGE